MAELVDAKDLKSFDPKRVVRVQVPPSAQFQLRAISSVGLERYIDIVEVRSSNLLSPTKSLCDIAVRSSAPKAHPPLAENLLSPTKTADWQRGQKFS